ncbi:uncharacterized protein LOC116019649 [Ipomoea triloba]|uniref:uncharacterized protein LOC116019649 n=1 Tax=Ipomoea triloba TaxID=35885 RepID=UPI00125D971F|nr:uncharacterized protein LOC116019649 [Ipomoea triloba]
MESVDCLDTWIADMWLSLPKDVIIQVIVICWAAWENRNNMVFNQHCMNPKTMVATALMYYNDWLRIRSATTSSILSQNSVVWSKKWQPPMHNFLKVNVDVALDFTRKRMGFGWVVRGEGGVVNAMGWRVEEGVFSVHEAEAVGVREVLSWVKQKGWSRVIVETDAQVVSKAVYDGGRSGPFGLIIEDIRSILHHLDLVVVHFVKRDANMLAHAIAKSSLDDSCIDVVDYFDCIPRFISCIARLDLVED